MQSVLPPDLATVTPAVAVAKPRRWSAFSISLVLHAAVSALLLSTSPVFHKELPVKPDYKVLIVPLTPKAKILFHSLKSPVPEVAPLKRFGPEATPHGQKDPSGQVLIAVSPKPDSSKQIIRQPAHPEPIPFDISTPNLLALAPDNPQPIPKPAPKVFVPPPPPPAPVRVAEPLPAVLEPPPSMKPSKVQAPKDLAKFLTEVPKFEPKPAPPPPAPPAPVSDASTQKVPTAPPSSGAPAASTPGPQAVIVSLNPGKAPPPQGSRSGQFAKAPEAGIPSSGAAAPNGALVPNLIAHGRPGESPKPPPPPTAEAPIERRLVKEIVMPGFNRTMSAPLRPSSRVLSRAIEANFAGRNVYTLVIPAPEVPDYTGDWVVWFAERQPDEDPRVRISAPIPVRKYAAAVSSAGAPPIPTDANVQFAAVLDKSGRISTAKTLRGATDPALRLKALEELQTWDFKPALRNGEPIDVDMVIEIPLKLRVAP